MYFIGRDGHQYGPYSLELLQGMAARHELQESDLIWADPMPSWQPAGAIEALFPNAQLTVREMPPVSTPEPSKTPAHNFKPTQSNATTVAAAGRQKWMRVAAVVLVSTMVAIYSYMNTLRETSIRARDKRNEQMMRSYADLQAAEQQMQQLNQRLQQAPFGQ